MAEFYVTNSLNLSKAVKFNITLRYFVLLGEGGDHKWVLEIGTTHPDINGDRIIAKKIYGISAEDLDQVIEEGVAELCSQIDWSPLVQDKVKPYVYSTTPEDGDTDVSIMTDIYVTIKDNLPSAGIDLSNMVITLNNSMETFDITNEVVITGDPYEFSLRWTPPLRVFDTYE
jgi:hypothetical protein